MRLPKSQEQLRKLLKEEYDRGFNVGSAHGYKRGTDDEKESAKMSLGVRERSARLTALETMTKLASTYGQLMQQLADAMRSEANQL